MNECMREMYTWSKVLKAFMLYQVHSFNLFSSCACAFLSRLCMDMNIFLGGYSWCSLLRNYTQLNLLLVASDSWLEVLETFHTLP